MSYAGMSVTYDRASNEYGGDVEDILKPMPSTMPDTKTVTGADIIARARSYIGRFSDGPDVPRLAQEVGRAWPEMASYAALAGNGTAWCGIFCAKVMTEFGIRPPFGTDDVHRWMWVDAWKDFGTPIASGQAQPGDVAMWFGSPHHVSLVAGNGRYCGGNQGAGVVSEASMRAPDAIRRPPVAGAITPQPIDMSNPLSLPLLVKGDVGPYVELLQKRLGSVEVDGEFGDDTEAAVRAWQASHPQLEVDGEVGPQTWASLLGKPVPKSDDPPKYLEYRAEYAANWKRMVVEADKLAAVDRIANRCLANKARYQAASAKTGVPWFVIAAWHDRESSGDFSTQLAQGDPLNQVSHNVPSGRGPFSTWEAGAYDALVTLKALNTVSDWTIERICYESERYNGFGYRSHGVPSAYLWSFSNIYTGGKYVSDGPSGWSSTAKDAQCGVLPLIQRLAALDSSIELRSYTDKPPIDEPDDTDEPDLPTTDDFAALVAEIEDIAADLRKRADTLNNLAKVFKEKDDMPDPRVDQLVEQMKVLNAALQGSLAPRPSATEAIKEATQGKKTAAGIFGLVGTLLTAFVGGDATLPMDGSLFPALMTLFGGLTGVGIASKLQRIIDLLTIAKEIAPKLDPVLQAIKQQQR